jgi:hypothetical protein
MNELILLLISGIVILVFASQVAGRLDRLHRRVSSARSNLWLRCNERYQEVQLLENAELHDAVSHAKRESNRALFSAEHLFAESELTRLLQAGSTPVSLQSAQIRLQDARRMYNEAVRATLYLRSWRISRWLKLSGRATAPKFVDFDDSLLSQN